MIKKLIKKMRIRVIENHHQEVFVVGSINFLRIFVDSHLIAIGHRLTPHFYSSYSFKLYYSKGRFKQI